MQFGLLPVARMRRRRWPSASVYDRGAGEERERLRPPLPIARFQRSRSLDADRSDNEFLVRQPFP